MGVFYFYTWITRRYPLFKRLYDPKIMPHVDNFFIDLNGVLYRCAKDESAVFKDMLNGKGFDEIFQHVLNYINFIVNHVKPTKRLFIAIDGVAPRAKMNNQRQRRYHSAANGKSKDSFLEGTLSKKKGQISFVNNSISPGTEFMMMLIDHIRFFLQRKIHEDPNWQKIEIIFSGGDVPGEGEHKIMEWLRAWKQTPEFDINESHCIYGNDSDLVFLALSLHLPNMVILREEMKWDRKKVNSATKRGKSSESMELLFINLLREYMHLEYIEYEPKWKGDFNLERIIDDFINLSFFIGNDFLHQLYCMNTKKGSFDEIITKFKETLCNLDGYITKDGVVNWKRFLVLIKSVLYMEPKMINTTLGAMQSFMDDLEKQSHHLVLLHDEDELNEINSYLDKRGGGQQRGRKHRGGGGRHAKGRGGRNQQRAHKPKETEEGDDDSTFAQKEQEKAVELAEPEADADVTPDFAEEDTDFEIMNEVRKEHFKKEPDAEEKQPIHYQPHEHEFRVHHTKIKEEADYVANLLSIFRGGNKEDIAKEKVNFYKRFFKLKDFSGMEEICLEYLKGIQFVMYYYFRGCPSWTWFYPYFMSPFLSDLVSMLETVIEKNPDLEFTFDGGLPFKPFNQLVFILPQASFQLLPSIYAETIFDPANNVNHFYPTEFDFEPFDGIKEYKWIADIEVIDKKQLDVALAKVDESKLSAKDKLRNRKGKDLIYRWDSKAPLRKIESTLPGLPGFEAPIVRIEFDIREDIPFDFDKISNSLEGWDNRCGYPTLFQCQNLKAKLRRIARRANYDKVVLEITPDNFTKDNRGVPQVNNHDGQVYYGYPFLIEGKINTILTRDKMKNMSNLESKSINQILKKNNANSRNIQHIHGSIEDHITHELYHMEGIDLMIDKVHKYEEVYYEIESSKSSWRTATPTYLNIANDIVQEFDNVRTLYSHTLLFKKKENRNMINICTGEKDLEKKGNMAINLLTGDIVESVSFGSAKDSTATFKIVKKNMVGINGLMGPKKLMETNWTMVNHKLLDSYNLDVWEINVVWMLLDSFVIKTDPSKTSALVLGQYFDIGFKFMNCLQKSVHDLEVVTDMVRMIRINHEEDYSLSMRKGKEHIPYVVYLSNAAKDIIGEYIKKFPEIVAYIIRNEKWHQNFRKIPRDHDVKKIYLTRERSDEFDPNTHLFNIYAWILNQKASTLSLNSALCINSSAENIKKLSDKIDDTILKKRSKTQTEEEGDEVMIDKNCVVFNNRDQIGVGTTFKHHPSYPYIGDRVVFTNNNHTKIPFGVTGTVIGTYKLDIEILFDEPFIGGTDLKGRCKPFRGGIVHFFDIFDLSIWGNTINKRADIDRAMKKSRNPRFEEWDGKIDLFLLIKRMNEFKRQYEKETFKNKKEKRNALKNKSEPFVNPNHPPKHQVSGGQFKKKGNYGCQGRPVGGGNQRQQYQPRNQAQTQPQPQRHYQPKYQPQQPQQPQNQGNSGNGGSGYVKQGGKPSRPRKGSGHKKVNLNSGKKEFTPDLNDVLGFKGFLVKPPAEGQPLQRTRVAEIEKPLKRVNVADLENEYEKVTPKKQGLTPWNLVR